MSEMLYVRDAGGEFYLEVVLPNGECEYLPAAKEYEAFEPVLFRGQETGKYRPIVSIEQHEANSDFHSSDAFFQAKYLEGLQKEGQDPATVRKQMKRREKLEQQLAQLTLDRVLPSSQYDVMTVTDNEFFRLRAEYEEAWKSGLQKKCEFQPLNTYHHKLVTKTGKELRPVLAGEVGMYKDRIVCLEAGSTPGTRVTVPEQLEKSQ